jgi:hypothetical protein
MGRNPRTDLMMEYAVWLSTPKRLKISLGLPAEKTQFAEWKGVNRRTLTRWEEKEDFQELVRQQKVKMGQESTYSTVSKIGPPRPHVDEKVVAKLQEPEPVTLEDDPVFDPSLSPEEQSYLKVKDTLIQMAQDGNQGAIDLYLKHYGKSFIAAETADFDDYRSMSDDELLHDVCVMLGVERVSRWLAERAAAVA